MKIKLSNSLILIAASVFVYGCTVDESQLIERARTYVQNNKTKDALLELKNILQDNPKNAEARYLLGEINMEYGDMASAEKEYQRALEEGWSPEYAVIGKMRAMISARKYKEVLAVSYDTKNWTNAAQANMQALQAIAYANSGNLTQAKSTLSIAEKLDENAYDVLKALITFQVKEKRNEDAEKTLSKALKLFPDDSALLLLNAENSIYENQSDRAIDIYKKIISSGPEIMTPDKRRAHLEIIKLSLVNDKDPELLNTSLKALSERKSNDPEADYFLAVAAFKEKKYDDAEGYLKKILSISTSHGPTLLLSGTVSYAKGNYEQAVDFLSKYLSLSPDNVKAHTLLGRAYMALGQQDNAQKEFKTGLKESPDDVELIALVGLSEIKSGQLQSGITSLEKALELQPDSQLLKQELAQAYIAEGQTDKAIKQLDEAIKKGDKNYQIRYTKILAYLRDKNIEMAMQTAQQLLDESPKNPNILNLMGNIKQIAGDESVARKYYNQALEIDPDYISANLNLAKLDESHKDLASAEKRYQSILNKKPDDSGVMFSLSKVAEQQGDIEKQIKWLEGARQANKKELVARVTLAEIYLKQNRISDVETLLREMEESHVDNPAVLITKSQLLMVQKRFTQAETIISTFINARPKDDLGYYLQAQNQLMLDKKSQALENARKAYSLKPDILRNGILLARIEQSAGNFEQALKLGEAIIKSEPNISEGYVIKANALLGTKKYQDSLTAADKAWSIAQTQKIAELRFIITSRLSGINAAIPIYESWLEKNPKDEVITLGLANVYLMGKQYQKSIAYFEKYTALNPNNFVVLNNLAWLYGLEKDGRAVDVAKKAHELAPESPAISDTYGWLLLNSGKTAEALPLLRQAAGKLPDMPDVQYHYAKALHASGDKAAAVSILKPLLASGKAFDGRSEAEMMLAQ